MSELIKERFEKSIGKVVKIFLDNNFRYYGKIINCDKEYCEIFDFKSNSYKIIKYNSIKDVEIEQ